MRDAGRASPTHGRAGSKAGTWGAVHPALKGTARQFQADCDLRSDAANSSKLQSVSLVSSV